MSRKHVTDKAIVKAAVFAQSTGFNVNVVEVLRLNGCLECEKVIYSALFRAVSRDLIEYGVSIRCSWPTSKGLELI